ncbi:MAG TPA: hypothetical protein VNM47_02275 [Terriglobia bacterium]|nr:hypothetical protein [Terriglobia bacterium]
MSGGHTPEQVARFQRELRGNPVLVEHVLQGLPPAPPEPERIIKCSPESAEIAVCRALARAHVHGEFWRIEMVK